MFLKIRAALGLGLINVFRILWFRLGLRLGINSATRIRSEPASGPFFSAGDVRPSQNCEVNHLPFGFGYIPLQRGAEIPDWHKNILTGQRCPHSEKAWYEIPDFGIESGDIKGIWELSRFDWVLGFVREYLEGNSGSLVRLEAWLADWARANPPYRGTNWKCGQEASIRVMHLAMAAVLMEQEVGTEKSMLHLVETHLRRIAPTIQYAMAQDNNHGTSEAAALFIGGGWLAKNGMPEGKRWYALGRKWLENRVLRLIESDGSFSQYSVNYHRVFLDTVSMVEVWRRKLNLPRFSKHWYEKAFLATDWLRAMVQPGGDVPNIGANDGARLFPLSSTDYRDFRPSIQLAASLFKNERAIPEAGEWDVPLKLLRIEDPVSEAAALGSKLFDKGGYATLRNPGSFALLRYPRFRFRPGHADPLHVDLWLDGENILRDGGSYSYNTVERWQGYFPGVRAHNTIQFDDREPMPRISRFLFGEWLKTNSFQPIESSEGKQTVGAGYRDYLGGSHKRRLTFYTGRMHVEDEVSGFKKKAVLRWRLKPGDWKLSRQSLTLGDIRIDLNASIPLRRIELVEGWESRYYGDKTLIPVLEVEVNQAGTLSTDIRWNEI